MPGRFIQAGAHLYAANGQLEGLLDIYLEDQNLMEQDSLGNTPLHYAAANDQRSAARGIISLLMPNESWLVKNKEGKTPIDLATPRIRHDMKLISMPSKQFHDHDTLLNNQLTNKILAKPNENHKVLLSIDGGGIKAILAAGTIMAIERELGENIMTRIHWLGGTSAGGIISVVLGCGYSCSEARKLFLREKANAFCKTKAVFPKNKSEGIEGVLKKYLGKHTKMSEIKYHNVMVTAAKVKCAPASLVLFRSYAPQCRPKLYEQYGYLDPEKILIWKAARATSAAPTYFESFNGHADGAIVCNNPCIALMTDFLRLKKLEDYLKIPNEDELGLVLSLGCGSEPLIPLGGIDIQLKSMLSINKYKKAFGRFKNLVNLFIYQCTSSLAVDCGQAREWAHSMGVPYFRLSPKLSKVVELDCVNLESIFDFMFENEVYLRTQMDHEIKSLVRLLKAMPKNQIQRKT